METIVVSTGWLVFISILTILHQLEIKIIIIKIIIIIIIIITIIIIVKFHSTLCNLLIK